MSAEASTPRVREPQPGDVEAWLALRYALYPALDRDAHERQIRRGLERSIAFTALLVEAHDGSVCGFIEIERLQGPEPRAAIHALFVAPSRRRRGMARALLAHAERRLGAAGVTSMVLDVPEGLEVTVGALERLGFSHRARLVRMQRSVSPLHGLARVDAPQARAPAATADPLAPPATGRASGTTSARRARWIAVNVALAIAAVLCLANTDVFSTRTVPGIVMPILDLLLFIYFLGLFLAWRYGRRADSSQRMGELYGAGDPER